MTQIIDMTGGGEGPTYLLDCECDNCGWEGKAELRKGQSRSNFTGLAVCPCCHCFGVEPLGHGFAEGRRT